ncbi:putative Ig domain-containing protein [Photobacterium sanguinicancri]|uniref:putative Ig domain-containing protein n=1 Tax=Photobacterium sanguinicancri TaxID=875932 RepID=UPI0021C38549|nr:putative Ig domain-containing protein [Photobacterium sanguinicancri]
MRPIALLLTLFLFFNISVSSANTLREAGGFSAFIFEDFTAPSGDADGPLYVGRNMQINGYSIGDGLPPETSGYILYVGGDITFPVGRLYYGDAIIGGRLNGIGKSVFDGLSESQKIMNGDLPLDLPEQKLYLNDLSRRLSVFPANGSTKFEWGGLYLQGDGNSNWQVFDLDASVVSKAHTFSVSNIPDDATIVFNISGTDASLTNKSFADLIPHRSRTIFNFPDAVNIRLAGVAIEGTVLAPSAHLDAPHGDAYGPLIAKSFAGAMHLGFNTFEGDLSFINRAPVIVSMAPNSVNERETYVYEAKAIDEDNDPLAWSVLRGPENFSVIADTGVTTWQPNKEFVDTLKGVNGYCSVPQEPTKLVQGAADILIAMDESGSMGGEQQWLTSIISTLESLLIERGVGAQHEENFYGAVGFGHRGSGAALLRMLATDGDTFVNAERFNKITKQFVASGGFEDGWSAAQLLLNDYPLRPKTAKNIILISDEDRDNGNSSITYESMKTQLIAQKAVLNVVIDGGFVCEDGRAALGMDADGSGYVAENDGSFSLCNNAKHSGRAFGATNAHYIQLALETGGAAWDLNYLRRGGVYAQAFSKAFVEIKVREIISQLPPLPQSDVIVKQISLPHDAVELEQLNIPVTLYNRGLLNISSEATLSLFEILNDGTRRELASQTLALNLATDQEQLISFNAVKMSDNAITLGASIGLADAKSECLADNNQTLRALVTLQVADDWGGVDTQLFEIGVNNINDPPSVENTEVFQDINAGGQFSFTPEVNDPDLGDQLKFTLRSSPAGVKIDARTGQVSWDTTNVDPGVYTYDVVATDLAGNSVTISVIVTVNKAPNFPPKITSLPEYLSQEGSQYRYLVTATDPNEGDTLVYSTSSGAINGASGELQWKSAAPDMGWQSPEICRQPLSAPSEFKPTIKWHWSKSSSMGSYNQVLAAPIVVQLNDDNADGEINTLDYPDVVVPAFQSSLYNSPGIIRVLSGKDGTDLWPASNQGPWADPSYGLAAADIDSDGLVEIVAGQPNGDLAVYENDGTIKWRKPAGGRGHVAIADLDADGAPEIVYAQGVYDLNGDRLFSIDSSISPIVFDADGDGIQEVLSGGKLYDINGNVRWQGPAMLFAGVADFDGDSLPEVVIAGDNKLSMLNHDGSYVWGPITVPGTGGGPITIADVDGDAKPEITLAAKFYYFVFEADGSVKWQKQTQDRSSQKTGSSVFDFDGDGQAEILYSDELNFRVYDGNTGDVIYQLPNPSGTLYEYPLVVDLDNDREAEIVLVSNNRWFNGVNGVRVLEGKGWAPTRSIWNQHAYHIDNINDDGTVPIGQLPSWLSHNTYRLNTFPGRTLTAVSDLTVADFTYIDGELSIAIGNGGEAKSQGGLTLTLLDPTTSQSLATWSLPSIEPNSQFAVTENIDFSAFSSVQLLIDAEGYETECNRFNNTANVVLLTVSVADEDGASDKQQFSVRTEPLNVAPSFVQPQELTLKSNQLLSFNLKASDQNAWDVITWRATGLPAAALFDPVKGSLNWTPTESDIGTHVFSFVAVDTYGATSKAQMKVTVMAENQPPVISSTPKPTTVEGLEWQYQIMAADPDGDSLIYEVMYPGEVQVDATGLVTWSLPVVGTHDILVRVRDGRGGSVEQSFQLVVETTPNRKPKITSTPLLSIEQGGTYQYQIVASDDDGDVLSFALVQFPQGMSLSASGDIQWVILANLKPGNYPVSIEVSDGIATVVQSYEITVIGAKPNQTPVITSSPRLIGTAGQIYQYEVKATDPDGDALTYTLTRYPEGMTVSQSGLIEWTVPENIQPSTYSVSIAVNDGFDSVEQSYTIKIETGSNNQPPVITSQPVTSVVAGTDYRYQVIANDPDKDSLAFRLISSPQGMTISSTGLVQWAVPAGFNDTVSVEIAVSDNKIETRQSYEVVVSTAGDNVAPVLTGSPVREAVQGGQYVSAMSATDADGDQLTFRLIEAPSGMTVDGKGRIAWSVPAELTGQVAVSLEVSDGTHFIHRSWTITISEWALPLDVTIGVSAGQLKVGEVATVQAQPTGGVPPYQVVMTANGQLLALDSQLTSEAKAAKPSLIKLVATVVDSQGVEVSTKETIAVITGTDTAAPVVSITSPVENAGISSMVDVVGTVEDDNLASYALIVYPDGEPTKRQILMEGFQSVSNSALASFDPSMLTNGVYTIAIEAIDLDGNQSVAGVDVLVSGDLKVGNFSITQRDVDIPMMGLPITVDRTYDSRSKPESSDFGHGWSLGLTDFKVQESDKLGMSWSLNKYGSMLNTKYCIEPKGARPEVTVTLPDGDVERFEAVLTPECSQLVPALDVTLSFRAIGDTQSTLAPAEHKQLRFVGGNLYDAAMLIDIADPNRYILTLKNDVEIHADQMAGLQKLVSPNGHSVQYTRDGLIHSAGKSVLFSRDSKGRITQVTDPSGQVHQYRYDGQGDLRTVIDPLGNETTFDYNRNHGLLKINDPLSRRLVRNIYDDGGRLIAQEDEQGNRTEFSHDIAGKQSVVTDRNGNTAFYYYDKEGNITSEVDAMGNTKQYAYDERGNKLSSTDALGNISYSTFNTKNDQLTVTDALGNTTEYKYNDRGQETEIIDSRGNRYVNTYDGIGNLVTLSDPTGSQATFEYDAKGNLRTSKDMLGNITSYTYDSTGNKHTEITPTGITKRFEYDSNNRVVREIVERKLQGGMAEDLVTEYRYDSAGNIIETINALGYSRQSQFDAMGQLIVSTDALGHKTLTDYDGYGREIAITYPDGSRTQKAYDAEGNLISETDAAGSVTTYVYDALNRQVAIIQADGSRVETEYDAAGRIAAEVDANGNRTTNVYDAANRRIATKDALGSTTQYEYDSEGNVTATIDPLGHRTEYEYDQLGNKTVTRFADGTAITAAFDRLGRKVAETDQSGVTTQFEYDAEGRLIAVVDAANSRTEYRYDELGNRIAQIDALGQETRWQYDGLGNVLSRTLPMGQIETFTYNALNQVENHTDFNGEVTTYIYDAMGRLITEISGVGTLNEQTQRYEYDVAGNKVRTSIETAKSVQVWEYQYDVLNRLTTELQPSGDRLSYQYDTNGNKLSLTVESQGQANTTTYTYDTVNRLSTVTDNEGGITQYSYTALGMADVIYHPNGISTHHVYDNLNRLIEKYTQLTSGAVVSHYRYSLSDSGQRTRLEELHSGRNVDYQYDVLNRLVKESYLETDGSRKVIEHEYSAIGNRTKEIRDGVVSLYNYDANDRLVTKDLTQYSYDANGNLLAERTSGAIEKRYFYNTKNRLISFDDGTQSAVFEYNSNGIRTSISINGVITHYIIDENRDYAQVVREYGAQNKSYVYGADLLSFNAQGTNSYFVYDGLGSTRALVDETGSVTDTYDYDGYGTVLKQTGASDNAYLYTGEQYDAELNNYYLRARFYSPSIGRFTQRDLWNGNNLKPVTLNKYLYGNASPVNFTDPSGYMSMMSVSIGSYGRGVLSSISIPSYTSILTRSVLATAVLTRGRLNVGVNSAIMARTIQRCMNGDDDCKSDLNIFVVGDDTPEARDHIGDAQSVGYPAILNRIKPPHPRGWLRKFKGPGKICDGGAGTDCDEYPYASSQQGGKNGFVSLRSINSYQNQHSGRLLGQFYSKCNINSGDSYKVLPVKGISVSGWICIE